MIYKYQSIEIPFIENIGQIKNDNIRYYAKTLSGAVVVTKDCQLNYSFSTNEEKNGLNQLVIEDNFIGTNHSIVHGESKAITRVNYFRGKDPSKWRTYIPTYSTINLGEIYKGIVVKLKTSGRNVETLLYKTLCKC